MNLNECTVIGGKVNDGIFLFKNRDKYYIADWKIIHEIYNKVEIAYANDKANWVEGMNEFGVGFVFSALMNKYHNNQTSKYSLSRGLQMGVENEDMFEIKGDKFKKALCSKTAKDMLFKLISYNYRGNYFIGDKNIVYNLEIFDGDYSYVEYNFKNNEYKVKTNHGELIPYAGQQPNVYNIQRSSSVIRQTNANRYIMGFKDFNELITRMGFQEFDKKSSLNVFKTAMDEVTISQMLLDLEHNFLYFIHTDKNSDFYGIHEKLPAKYTPKIRIIIRNKNEFIKNEYKLFMNKSKDLYQSVLRVFDD